MTSCTIGIRLDPKSEVRVSSTGEVQILGLSADGSTAIQINLGRPYEAWTFLSRAMKHAEHEIEMQDRARAEAESM